MESSNVIPSNVVPSQEPDQCLPQLTKKLLRIKLVPMPRRGTGSRGQKISLITNHFKVSMTNMSCHFYYYNVFLSHEDGRAIYKKGIGRKIMAKLYETYALELAVKDFAYDGKTGLYTLSPLSRSKLEFIVVLENTSSDRVARNDNIVGNGNPNESDRKRVRRASQARTFKVEISYVGKIPLQAIKNSLHDQGLDNFQEILRVLNTILRDHAAKQGCLLIGQSFFQNEAKNFMPLGGGIYGCRGFHSTFRATQNELSLNFDVSSTAIIQPGPVIDFLMANQNVNDCFHIDWKKAERTLKNLRIMVAPSNTEYRITGLSKRTCKKETFQIERHESSDARTKIVTVYDYFVNHRDIVLHYSKDFPCINVGKPNPPTYFPIELCSLVSLQRYTKALTIHQRSSLVEKASHRPQEKIRILTDGLKSNNYDADPMLQSLGLSINTRFAQVEGRILSPPMLRVGNKEDIIPRNGRWSLNNKKFFEAAKIKRWAVVNFSSPFDIGHLCKDLKKAGEIKGMVIDCPKAVFEEDPQFRQAPPSVRVEKMFEQIQSKFPKDEPPFFLLCLLPDRRISRLYGPWKRKTLADFGVYNQCLATTRIHNEQCLTNFLCKINAKLGGLNSVLAAEHLKHIPLVSKAPTIIFGMDVSHGSSGQFDVPSVAAVVSSRYWPLISRYKAAIRMQPPKVEIINSLFNPVSEKKDLGIIRELLVDFYASSGKRKPTQIIIFRDGVGESQFNQVLNIELGQIIEACKFLDDNWSPKFTVIVALKRHHTRFFQSRSPDNVPPGTIVDSKVCHPQYYDFYMCPHPTLMGTTKPIHYYVLLDENGFPTDELQELIHSLSYVYQKGTTAISEVAPIRYAHLAAAQMSAILNSDGISEQNSSNGSLPSLHEDVCSSMFFC